MIKRFSFFILLACLAVFGCKNESENKCVFVPDYEKTSVTPVVESLEDALPAITTKKQLVDFLTRHPVLRDGFFGRENYPGDSAFINSLFTRFTHPAIDTLLMETHRIFGDGSALRDEFKQAFSDIRYYYPGFRAPKIITMISGFQQGADLMVSDSLIVVGLDYYLGAGAKYRPNDMYAYMLRRYRPNFVVPSVLLLYGIDPKFNKTNLNDRTVLADMISYGKAFYFARHMLPCVPDSIFLGYSSEEIEGATANEAEVYARLIENEVLYSTSHQIKQRYIEERPRTLEIGERCPGRIGQWVGWQIIKKYAERHQGASLPDIMNIPDATKIFKDANYKPRPK
jgi:hypothetical protein